MDIIQACLEEGITKISDILLFVKSKISSLKKERDSKKLELINLNVQINDLNLLLKQIEKKDQKQSIVHSTKWNELSNEIKEKVASIIENIGNNDKIQISDLNKNISDPIEIKNGMIAMNWLIDQKYISRMAPFLSKGPNWKNKKDLYWFTDL